MDVSVRDCGPHPSIEKGTFNATSGTLVNATAVIDCTEGFKLPEPYTTNSLEIFCLPSGEWSHRIIACEG